MKKNTWINLAIVVLSTVITLFIAEHIFRRLLFSEKESFQGIKNPSIYSHYIKHKDGDLFDDIYWKLNYIFYQPFNVTNPDPLLNWVGSFKAGNREHFEEEQVKERRPVLLYGDSFSQCVDTVQCFEDFLNQDTIFNKDHYLLNFGVGGYGVDQIYLLFRETVDRYDHPFVIFGLLTTDMDRCMVSFRDAQKPYFILADTGLQLNGVPISGTTQEYVENNPPCVNSYLWNRFQNADFYPFRNEEKRAAEMIEKTKALNKAILQKAFEKLRSLNTDFTVLIFHPEYHRPDDWRLVFLRELMEAENIPYICDLDIRNNDTTFSTYDAANYCIPGNGHPTSYLNGLISKKLKVEILKSGKEAEFSTTAPGI